MPTITTWRGLREWLCRREAVSIENTQRERLVDRVNLVLHAVSTVKNVSRRTRLRCIVVSTTTLMVGHQIVYDV